MIACLDVDYRDHDARAACVLIPHWTAARPERSYLANVRDVLPYQPGSFYRRELPGLLAVLRCLAFNPDIIVVDGYVWLPLEEAAGLGSRLHAALHGASAVVGVAKTELRGARESSLVVPVLRGRSGKPLYVTSVGIGLDHAATMVKSMHGDHRIPSILRYTDQLARGRKPVIREDAHPAAASQLQ